MPCIDSKGEPIDIKPMKLSNSIDDFSSHLWEDSIKITGLNCVASSNEKLLPKLESICMEESGYKFLV